MKVMKERLCFLILGICLQWQILFGHDVIVHIQITQNAAAFAAENSSSYADFLNTVIPDLAPPDALFL